MVSSVREVALRGSGYPLFRATTWVSQPHDRFCDLFSINMYKPLITPGDFTKIHYGSLT